MHPRRTAFALTPILFLTACTQSPQTAASPHPAPTPTPFIGYWSASESYGKPHFSTSNDRLDIMSDSTAVLITPGHATSLMGDQPPVPDEIRHFHWTLQSPGIRLTESNSPATSFDARLEGDNTLVFTGPDFYLRFQRQ